MELHQYAPDVVEQIRAIHAKQRARSAKNSQTGSKLPAIPKQQSLWSDLRWDEIKRAIPNHLAHSSLFAPIKAGKRKRHDKIELASRSDVKIIYSGPQLDEFDRDVFMQLIFEALKVPIGARIYINRADFIRSIGRAERGSFYYKRFHAAMGNLFEASLFVETKRYQLGKAHARESWLHLITSADFDEESGAYYASLDPRLVEMFSNQEFSLIDWHQRIRIGHDAKQADMAKWLQCLIATSRDPIHRHQVLNLKAWMAYSGRLRDYRKALLEALTELERLAVIAAPRFETGQRGQDLVVWHRL